ncbi:MAG: Flp family type IVb pilin [Myxococcota bacterium]
MGRAFDAFIRDEAGATAIEYALIGTLVAVACVAAFRNFASATNVIYAVIEGITTYL